MQREPKLESISSTRLRGWPAGSRAWLEGDRVGRLWRDSRRAVPGVGFDLGARALVQPERADAHAARAAPAMVAQRVKRVPRGWQKLR